MSGALTTESHAAPHGVKVAFISVEQTIFWQMWARSARVCDFSFPTVK